VRARWTVEDLARGQWQIAVTELPLGVSTRLVLEDIERATNPKPKEGQEGAVAGAAQPQEPDAFRPRRGPRRIG
jgi:topoisomerase-4 subunit A